MLQDIFRKKSIAHIEAEAAAGLHDEHGGGGGLKKVLTTRDLTLMGIAAVVGAGIFSTIGKASFDGGPGIVLLFLFVSVACGFSALCYAEFASMVPVSGSAYTYSYVAFGEIVAWIIGWDLLMEYAIGNIAVAISWSDYFTGLLEGIGIHLPEYLTMDYWTAKKQMTDAAKTAWQTAPQLGGSARLICDLPAFFITAIITAVIYVGIKESKKMTNAMVVLKLMVIGLVVVAGAFYVQPTHWHPFLPNGIGGVMKGTAAVFFAYIGFDAISTTAEECKNPQRDLPRGMIYSLILCTIIYIAIALVITGMVSYKDLNVGDPMRFVFEATGLNWIAGIVAVSAVIATASVLLVFQLGQPRIWMSMSRDGLLPPVFSRIHPRFQTPSFSTVLTGILVGVPALFLNLDTVVDLCSVGTLFAFVLVCGGILMLNEKKKKGLVVSHGRFTTPFIGGRYIVPAIFIAAIILIEKYVPGGTKGYLLSDAPLRERVPYMAFAVVFIVITVLSAIKNYSLIPVLGFLACAYLLCESGTTNWERFLIWLVIGLVVYFVYGFWKSKMRTGHNSPV